MTLRKITVNFSTFAFTIAACIILLYSTHGIAADEPDQQETPAQPVIVSINIQGLNTISPAQIVDRLESKPGEPLDLDKVTRDQKRLFSMGYFTGDIKVEQISGDKGITLVFWVKENPVIEDIRIIGNKAFSSDRIIALCPQQVGDTFRVQTLGDFRKAILKLYTDGGYNRVSVTTNLTQGTEDDKTIIEVMVDDGEKIKIRDALFIGNDSIGGTRLRSKIKNKGSWGFLKNYLDQSALEEDRRALEYYYSSKGYLDVKIEKPVVDYSEIKNFCDVTYIINEGPRYFVEDVKPVGAEVMKPEEIAKCFDDSIGHTFSSKKVDQGIKRVEKLYGDEGYMKMTATLEYDRDPETGKVVLVPRINENTRMYVGQIKIERAEFSQASHTALGRLYDRFAPPVEDEVIEREVRLSPGKVYRRYEEVRTVERLKNLGLFENVTVTHQHTQDRDIWNPIVSIVERPSTGRFLFSIGVDEDAGVFGTFTFHERNLFGDARDLLANFTIGTDYQSFRLSYIDRFFNNTEDSVMMEIFRTSSGYDAYDFTQTGVGYERGHPLGEYLKKYISYRLSYVEYDVDSDVENDPGDYVVAKTSLRWVQDTRDSEKFPRHGSRFSYGMELGAADGPLLKFTSRYVRFFDVSRNWVYMMDVMGGVTPVDVDDFGHSEHFFLGGRNDLRGFVYRGAGYKDDGDEDFPLGGAAKLLMRNEMRRPFNDSIYGLIFFDIGAIGENAFKWDSPRASTGIGIQFLTEAFRLRVELALPLIKDSDDNTRILHFGMGLGF